MNETEALYQLAQDEGIPVLTAALPETGSVCLRTEDARCYIGMDEGLLDDGPALRVRLAHELGHCMTGAFYNRWAALDVRQRHERRADIWAIERTVPAGELEKALAGGLTEVWQLAERFGVTEDFIRKAVCWYRFGNLDAEAYFGPAGAESY